ncbi:Uncharacterised protein [Bacteroides xylanisolvens]|nr:Uncharacterised protein [Bacteroides xylanisolvens]
MVLIRIISSLVKWLRVSPWGGSSIDRGCNLSLNDKLEMRNGGAAHKNIEAPQSVNSGDAMNWHSGH